MFRQNLLRAFLSFSSFVFVLSGCSSTKPAPEYGPGLPEQPVAGPTSGNSGAPGANRMRIGLVVAGSGVASFGTVGILKKLAQEGITPEYIVATGWPAVFATAYGFSQAHGASQVANDVEWFATKLKDQDFGNKTFFGFSKGDGISDTLNQTFGAKDLSASRLPLVILAPPTDTASLEVFERGDWKLPISRSLFFPGLFKPFPEKGAIAWSNAKPIDVTEGIRRGAEWVIAISMYSDYVEALSAPQQPADAHNFGKRLSTLVHDELGKTPASAYVRLNRKPTDFEAKRAAIQAGFRVTANLLKQLRRRPASDTEPAFGPVDPASEVAPTAAEATR